MFQSFLPLDLGQFFFAWEYYIDTFIMSDW